MVVSSTDGRGIYSALANKVSDGIAGSVFGDGVLVVVNGASGVVRGGDRAISQIGNHGLTLTNRGTIEGEIYLGADDVDVVRNAGTILGERADVFNGAGGRSGKVHRGTGNDTLGGGPTADRMDGGYGNDVLIGRGGRDLV